MLCSSFMKTDKRRLHLESPGKGWPYRGAAWSYLSPAPQAEPQAAGFSSGLPDAPQAEPQAAGFSSGLSAAPQAAGLSDAPQEEPAQLDRLESAMVVYLQFMFVEPVSRFAILS